VMQTLARNYDDDSYLDNGIAADSATGKLYMGASLADVNASASKKKEEVPTQETKWEEMFTPDAIGSGSGNPVEVPVCEKVLLTVEEAVAYTNLDEKMLKAVDDYSGSSLSVVSGGTVLYKRKALLEFLEREDVCGNFLDQKQTFSLNVF